MRKLVLSILGIFLFQNAQAQEATVAIDSVSNWKKGGTFTFLFNQTAFNNDWMAGGTSSIAGNVNVNYDINYAKGDWTWDTKFIGAYGQAKLKGDGAKKTDDRIDLNSVLGKKAKGNWYYSLMFNARTQFDSGFDPDGVKISHFFSPAFFQLGPGMLWKKSDNLKVNISPLNSKLVVVHDEFTLLGSSYGVEQGKTTRYELGAAINAYYKFDLFENVSMENILNLYSNYLEDPKNIDIDYQMNIAMKVNKYITTNIAFQAIYDDNARKAFQIRQLFGLGLNYNF
nr:DUF3078 domain-containing protein [uncultured Flavobacterium sp.]